MLSSAPIAFIAFVIGFGFLVFIHELGHFLVAKWVGIRCTQFAIGFGPAICSWRKGVGFRLGSTEADYHRRAHEAMAARGANPQAATHEQVLAVADKLHLGETEYRLNYLPLGGYVKMLGQEDLDAAARSPDPRSFNNKSVGARFAVISAGVIMNLITGVILFIVAFMSGVEFPPAVVGAVGGDAPAAKAYAVGHDGDPAYRGLRVGDRITHIDGEAILDFTEIKIASALGAADEPIELTVQREGVPEPLTFRVTPEMSRSDGLLSFGIAPPFDLKVGGVVQDSAAAKAGVKPGMVLLGAGDRPVTRYADAYEAIVAGRGEPVPLTFADPVGGARAIVELTAEPPMQTAGDPPVRHLAGFVPAAEIGGVTDDSPAAAAGARAGDLIAELGGEAWPAFEDVSRIVQAAGGRPVELVVWRDGEAVNLGQVQPTDGRIGVMIAPELDEPIVGRVLSATPAAALDMTVGGSRLLSVGGRAIDDWATLARTLASAEPGDIPVEFRLNAGDGVTETRPMPLPASLVSELNTLPWQVDQRDVFFELAMEPLEAETPWEATVLGVEKTRQFIMQAYTMILRLTQGTVGVQHLSGPVGIVDQGTQVTQRGPSYLFYFLGLLSVNLAVINFLPIPIADGGHAVFLIAEKIKGSPVSAKVQVAAMYVGLLLIGGVFLLVTYNDILKMFSATS